MYQVPLAQCPYCHQGTLANGYFCAFCGAQLRQLPEQAPAAPAQQQPAPQRSYNAPPPQQQQQQPPARYAPPQQAAPPPQAQQGYGGGGRSPLVCPNCNAANDPWLTHCKTCGRPLMVS